MRLRPLFLCLLLLSASSVWADDEEPQEQLAKAAATDAGAGWILGAGVAVTNPGYLGYSRQITPLPLVFYHYGRFFFAGISGGYLLSNGEHYRLALVVEPTLNRLSASDSPQLAGIQSRQWSLAGGAELETFGDWGHLNMGLSHDLLGRNDGTSANLGYRFSFHAGGWSLSPGIGLRWADSNLTNYYYGVSPAEALLPQRPAYSPGSAASPYVSFGVGTAISEHWQFRGDISYQRFGSAIHNSPIVDRSGSPTLFIAFVYNPRDN
ncbi:MAG TPA: MipA/OmpV family protein [Gammaproteobacteria bacterium]|jgi:outer membrane protein